MGRLVGLDKVGMGERERERERGRGPFFFNVSGPYWFNINWLKGDGKEGVTKMHMQLPTGLLHPHWLSAFMVF